MTLNQLIQKAQSLSYQLSSGDIPLYDEAYIEIQDIRFEVITDDGDPYVQITTY